MHILLQFFDSHDASHSDKLSAGYLFILAILIIYLIDWYKKKKKK
jgi:hypothetical protein